ncbi:FUSC family protein [Actinomadura hibisca]|uniref:FUSC family protein n=1 Tax=Actinomadura hibisca TaxID=68565 RepID=UPI0008310F81|nr:aromatic acid exporter family protein [Actinomadura hibisca]
MTTALFRPDDRSDRLPLQVATEVQSTAFRITRLTLTAVAAYLMALWLLPKGGPAPLLAPLTALLVVQYSVYQTIKSSVLRVLAVTSGVLVAVLFANGVGFTWWSLGLTILCALIIGTVLRLGDHMLEVPISAMLIFALGATNDVAATDRILETLIGSGVGLLATFLVPSVRVRPAQEAVESLGDRLAALVKGLGDDVRGGLDPHAADRRAHQAADLFRDIGSTDEALGDAEDSVRLNLNPRAVKLIDAGVALRNGVETMEHFTLSLRGLTRALTDSSRLSDAERVMLADAPRRLLAETLDELAAAMTVYARLVRSDLTRDARPEGDEQKLDWHIRNAREHRDHLVQELRERADAGGTWPLYGEVLMHLDRLIDHLRVEHRARARESWRQRRRVARHLPARPARVVDEAGGRLRRAAAAASLAAQRNAVESDLGRRPTSRRPAHPPRRRSP